MKQKNKEFNLTQHDQKEIVFFTRMSSTLIEKGNSGIPNTYENYKKGLANKTICRTISVNAKPLNLEVLKTTYPYFECVRVPKNYEKTVKEINELIAFIPEEQKTDKEKIEEQNIKISQMQKQMALMIENKSKIKNKE